MNLKKLIIAAEAVEKLAYISDTSIDSIVDSLEGVAFDEETCGDIKAYHRDEIEFTVAKRKE